MLPDELKHSQDDLHSTTTMTSGPSPGAAAPTSESRPFWERPEVVSLEHGISLHRPGYGAPGRPPFPPFPPFPAQFPFFGHQHHGPPPPPPPPGPPGEHPDPPLPPPPPPAPPASAQDPLGSFGPWRNYLENIASWTQQAVNDFSAAGKHGHGHGHHHHHPHFDPRRGGRRGHHHEGGSDSEGPGHRGHGGPGGPWGPPHRGGWGAHRGRWGRRGHCGRPHSEFVHPAMDIISSDDAYTVTIELPGLKKDDVEISVHERALTVSGAFGCKPDISAPAPPDSEGYSIGDLEDEDDTFIDVDNKNEKKEKGGVILKERRVGKFKRSIDLPSWVDAEKGIKASMADGVLTIIFTKGPESKAKKVDIL